MCVSRQMLKGIGRKRVSMGGLWILSHKEFQIDDCYEDETNDDVLINAQKDSKLLRKKSIGKKKKVIPRN